MKILKRNINFIIVVILVFFCFLLVNTTQAGSGHNVWGWIWAGGGIYPDSSGDSTIGWISLNSINCDENEDGFSDSSIVGCPPADAEVSDYGLNINPDGTFSGYAWAGSGKNIGGVQEATIGWIRFDPQGPYPGSPNFSAKLDLDGAVCDGLGNVCGWARACSVFKTGCQGDLRSEEERGGWDGWIKLRCYGTECFKSDYGVHIAPGADESEFHGWAWGSDIVGWISFEWAKTSFPLPDNQQPDPPSPNPDYPDNGIEWDHCAFKGISVPVFHWTYSDPDNDPIGTDEQTAYEIRIYKASDPSKEFTGSGGGAKSFRPDRPDWENFMEWNTSYKWTVRTRDSYGSWSDWSIPAPFTTDLHAHPYPDFSHTPTSPVPEEEVIFEDRSECYDDFNDPHSCIDLINSYQWDFSYEESEGFNIDSVNRGDTVWTYLEEGQYQVKLKVKDDMGTCDTLGDTESLFDVSLPLPDYQEIPPISFLKKFLASFFPFFQDLLIF